MDEYVDGITLAIFGRVRVCKRVLKFSLNYYLTEKGDVVRIFLRACNNAEFCRYYFHPNGIQLGSVTDIKYVIFDSVPDVFKYVILTFPKLMRKLRIQCYVENVIWDCGTNVFEHRRTEIEYTDFESGNILTDSNIDQLNEKRNDIFEMLRERGFTIHIDNDRNHRAELITE